MLMIDLTNESVIALSRWWSRVNGRFVGPGSPIEEAAQHRRVGEERHVGVHEVDRQFGVVDVDRVVAIGHDGSIAAHRIQRLFRRWGLIPPPLSLHQL